LVRASDC